jgi:glycerol-3-phosphate dehydrogenase
MKRSIDALTDGTFDLLILGGGITGAGVALDATLRGLRVALIDKGDFASGTSSVSSKLIHGGLRYLEQAAFHLVYEALHERGLLLQNAPHLVTPLRFILPFYKGQRVRPWQWRVALTLYDILAGANNIRRSRAFSGTELRRAFPNLRDADLLGGADYFDAQMDDARLCIEVIRTAALHGACAANYVEATAFELLGNQIAGVRAWDHVSGAELVIRSRQVLNATGPWVDTVCRLAGDGSGPYLEPTKGVHLIAPAPPPCPAQLALRNPSARRVLGESGDGPCAAAFVLLHPVDGRVFFVIPWLGRTLIGTTDTFTSDGPDSLRVQPDETAYLLEAYNHYFQPPLRDTDILGAFAGLRPLILGHAGKPSSLSREFRLLESPSGLLSAAGGKYTTYRQMAEEITDVVARRLGNRRLCRTRHFPLDGAPPREPWGAFSRMMTSQLTGQYGLGEEAARHLVRRYGRRAPEVVGYLSQDPKGLRPLITGEPDLQVEIRYQREQEMAIFPADHFLRRMRLGMYRPECGGWHVP